MREAVAALAERGIVADYMRIRAFPFGETVEKFLAAHERIFVVEQNRDAQLRIAADAGDRRAEGEAAVRSWCTAASRCRRRHVVDGDHQPAANGPSGSVAMPIAETVGRPPAPAAATSSGLTLRDYEGALSTLCAGCGHDSVTAAIVRSFYELDTPPHMIAKLSGIGCSSKTPTYFVSGAHGFNSAHGRMPSIATGANAANRELTYIGISGDGDSLSIGIGQLCHAIRRNLNMLYVIENNGVYGLTKGQFSASADVGSKSKRGEANRFAPIDPVRAGAGPGRDVRGAQLLGRQGAAGADPQGGAVAQAASRSST